ncbi:hypothetical protein DB30_04130 [Enhygromyxa salina]|uniref:DUF1232 domain-containing protein n=1 Tax=Enhygromyxa salina TaxID=215803 RepID=A0A0C2D0N0_9BACT|nr:hypothetical protein [Enhygromyxa salina]KIG16786.1 hypothetical protein DB30_04130 [Enhygromyxa salina]
MDTTHINEMIETALAIEAKEGHLANYLQDRAAERGLALGHKQRREAIELFEGYVRSVPDHLSAAAASSLGTPVEATMAQVIRSAVAYWDEPDDLIPNELGLLGLLDDAYFTMRVLQLVSDRLHAESGQALIKDNLAPLEVVIREILGDLADVLDELVALAMANAAVDQLIAKVMEYSGSFILKSAQTSFAGMSIDALVENRLSFTTAPDDSLRDELITALEAVSAGLANQTTAPSQQQITAGMVALEQVLRRERDDYPFASESDIEAIGAMLVGAVVVQVINSGGEGHEPNRGFVERCVDLVLDGAE